MFYAMKIAHSDDQPGTSRKTPVKSVPSNVSPSNRKAQTGEGSSLTWTEKYRPKVPNDLIGNQSIVRNYALTLLVFEVWFLLGVLILSFCLYRLNNYMIGWHAGMNNFCIMARKERAKNKMTVD